MNHLKQKPWLALILGPIVMIAPVLLSGKVIYWGTPFMQFVPWRVAGWEVFAKEGLPYWNSLSGMGAPLIANYQSAWFYPPNWILLALQALGGVEWQAWGQALVILLHWIFSAFGTSFLLKRLGVKGAGQVIGGLAFALSGYLVGRAGFLSMNAASAWLPWVTLAADTIAVSGKIIDSWKRIQLLMGLSLAIGLMLLSGHAQLSWYILVFSFAWMIVRAWLSGRFLLVIKSGVWFILAGILGAGIAAIQLIPTLEYLSQSQRASSLDYAYTVNYSFYPWRLLGFIAPDLFGNPASGDYWLHSYIFEEAVYIGFLPLILAVSFGWVSIRRRRQNGTHGTSFSRGMVFFLLAVIVTSMVIAMGQFLPVFPFLYHYVPTFDMFQAPARWSVLAVFSLALLAGFGTDAWNKPIGKNLYWTRLFTAGGAAIGFGAGLAWMLLGDVRPTFIRSAALVGLWSVGAGILSLAKPNDTSSRRQSIWISALFTVVILDLCIAGWSLNPAGSTDLFTQAQAEAEKVAIQAGGHRIYMPPEVESELKFKQMFAVDNYPDQADLASLPQTMIPNVNLLGHVSSANNFDPLTTGRYNRWMDLLGKMSAEDRNGWLRFMDVSLVASLSQGTSEVLWKPVINPGYYRFSDCVIGVKDGEGSLDALLKRGAGSVDNSTNRLPVILEGEGKEIGGGCLKHIEAEIVAEGRNTVEHTITVNASSSLYLIEAESWYPGWKAEVDGVPVVLEKADYLFRAVQIPAGEHTVRIYYQPTAGVISRTITLLVSLVIIIAHILATKLRRGETIAVSQQADQ